MRILISAYACEPSSGSEPGVGWNWAVQAARHGHDVVVITRSNNRASIESAIAQVPIPGLRFRYIDLPRPFLAWKRHLGHNGLISYYYAWQAYLWLVARRLDRQVGFDVVQHVTFVNDWLPSGAAGVSAPFIWGPVGGSTHVMPPVLAAHRARRFRRYEWTRRVLQEGLKRFDPFVALTRRRARVILTYTEEALEGIPAAHRHKAVPVVHIGITESDVPTSAEADHPQAALTVLSGGRLVHWKGFDLLLEGFAEFVRRSRVDATLRFTGEGSFRPTLEALAREHGVSDRVVFLGKLDSLADVFRELEGASLYALPTLRDGPPTAILEAMLAGKPILCLDIGATRELVPDGAGFKIGVGSREQIVADIAGALESAATHRTRLHQMGRNARSHALEVHDWNRIGDTADAIYRSLAR
jgi:glycosyltransferase involved in cell wall biosynthesis